MEVWVLLLVVAIGWYVASRMKASAARAERARAAQATKDAEHARAEDHARNESLAIATIDLSAPRSAERVHINEWWVDFRIMRGTWKMVVADQSGVHQDDYTEHTLRRLPDGRWERKETDRSHAAFLAREKKHFDAMKADGYREGETWEERLNDWAGWSEPRQWLPMEDEVASALSARYDVFISRWRGDLPRS